MVYKILSQDLDNLELFVVRQTCDGCLDHAANGKVVGGDEAAIVEEGNRAHDELAVEAVRHATVAGDRVAKVLDLECALQTRGEEATEWCDERGEGGEDDHVKLHRHDVEGMREDGEVGGNTLGDEGDGVGLGSEDGVGFAFEAREDGCA